MTITLYGYVYSTCVKRVASVLHEKNVPFKFEVVDVTVNAHKTPEFLEKHPFGQVPVLDDDGYIIYESRAICRYIAEKYEDQGTALIPKDLKARGRFEQAASVEAADFDVYASRAVAENLFKPIWGQTPDPVVFARLIKSLDASLDVYEKILSKQKYVAGDELTLADLFHIPYAVLLPDVGYTGMKDRPNVSRWLEDITARPSWQAVKDIIESTA